MTKRILVVAAHADDEVLGCGGTIARHAAEGDAVSLILMADGVNSRIHSTSNDLNRRMHAAEQAAQILGITSSQFLGLPDNAMDSVPFLQIVQLLEPIINEFTPNVIYTHYHGDLNIDHRLTQQAVMTACRPQPHCNVEEIYGFEVLSSTEWAPTQSSFFAPNAYMDITRYISIKSKAIEAYQEEMRSPPHTRSATHAELLAKHRGYCIGVEYAEAFHLYRKIKYQ